MKRLLIGLMILAGVFMACPAHAANVYPFSGALTGGGTGALDAITGVSEGDIAIGGLEDDATYGDALLVYVADDDSGASESAPTVIDPDESGDIRWKLVDIYQMDAYVKGGNINTGDIALTIGDGTTDSITLSTDGTGDGEIMLPNDSIGNAEMANDAITMAELDDDGNFTDLTGNWTTTGAIQGGTVSDGTVTLAGDGTITGLSAGGLPDNSIDSGCIAENAVTASELNVSDVSDDIAGDIAAGELTNDSVLFEDLDDDGNYGPFTGAWDFTGGSLEIPNTSSNDQTLTEGQIGLKTDEDLLVIHGGSAGEVQDEAGISLIQHLVMVVDLSWYYDQESTYHALPIMTVGDDFPHGVTIVELSLRAVGGDPTTELTSTDLYCDTTPDYNLAADATKMDDLDTTAGVFTEDSTFVSATCANGSFMYIDIGADPTDDNVVWIFEMWFYANEDDPA